MPSAKPSSSVAGEADRCGAEQAERDLGLLHRLVQHILGIEEGALHRNHAQVVFDGRDHGGHRPLGGP